MPPSRLTQIFSLIPPRRARRHSGTPFGGADSSAVRRGVQLAHLAPFLNWTCPLLPLGREAQQALGTLPAHGRAAPEGEGAATDQHDDEDEPELEPA